MELEMEEPEMKVTTAGPGADRAPARARETAGTIVKKNKKKLLLSTLLVIVSSVAFIYFDLDISPLLDALMSDEDDEYVDNTEETSLVPTKRKPEESHPKDYLYEGYDSHHSSSEYAESKEEDYHEMLPENGTPENKDDPRPTIIEDLFDNESDEVEESSGTGVLDIDVHHLINFTFPSTLAR